MDNSQKALQMAFAAFLFVIAASTAIFLYTTLMTNAKQIMVISDNNNMSAEYVDHSNSSSKRYISKDEIAMTILDIENNKSYIDKIIVKNEDSEYTFTSDMKDLNGKLKNLLSTISSTDKYRLTYDASNKILKYIKQ